MKTGDILREAADLVDSTRAEEHGDFHELAKDIAIYWELHLKRVHGVSVIFDGWDIAMMLSDLKRARGLQNREKMDNPKDQSGYIALGAAEVRRDVPD
jgi:hypothetical protein